MNRGQIGTSGVGLPAGSSENKLDNQNRGVLQNGINDFGGDELVLFVVPEGDPLPWHALHNGHHRGRCASTYYTIKTIEDVPLQSPQIRLVRGLVTFVSALP